MDRGGKVETIFICFCLGMGRGGKVEAVLTCQGNISDPDFPDKCQDIFNKLSKLLDNSKYIFYRDNYSWSPLPIILLSKKVYTDSCIGKGLIKEN